MSAGARLTGVAVDLAIRIDVREMAETMSAQQIEAVMAGLAQCASAGRAALAASRADEPGAYELRPEVNR